MLNKTEQLKQLQTIPYFDVYEESEGTIMAFEAKIRSVVEMWGSAHNIKDDIHFELHSLRTQLTSMKRELGIFYSRLQNLINQLNADTKSAIVLGKLDEIRPSNKDEYEVMYRKHLPVMYEALDITNKNIGWLDDEISGIDQQINGLSYFVKLHQMMI